MRPPRCALALTIFSNTLVKATRRALLSSNQTSRELFHRLTREKGPICCGCSFFSNRNKPGDFKSGLSQIRISLRAAVSTLALSGSLSSVKFSSRHTVTTRPFPLGPRSGSTNTRFSSIIIRYKDCHVIPCETTFAPSAENRGAIEGGTSQTQGKTILPPSLVIVPVFRSSTCEPSLPSVPKSALSKLSEIGENIVLLSVGFGRIDAVVGSKIKPPVF
mmetsp:Transcript_24178/g.57051  ORF Transcript_24178/g.57051 Transcript_24178/m.57051 type:complete len:218 (-) Transcript_24178:25-678(-)